MKTITSGGEIAALLETLPEGAILRTSDGVANQFHRYGYGQYQEHLAGGGYWTRTDATYLPEIIPDRLLPATLVYPVIFDAEDWQHEDYPGWVAWSAPGDWVVARYVPTGEVWKKHRADTRTCLDTQAAFDFMQEFFAAHPEPKPWHEAKTGEVWVLETASNLPSPEVFRVSDDHYPERKKPVFVPLNENYPISHLGPSATIITAARRIWPEVSNGE